MQITENGIIKDTPEEIKQSVISYMQNMVPSYYSIPTDLRNNLIDEVTISALYFQDMIVNSTNSIGLNTGNEYIFYNLGRFIGLTPRDFTHGVVVLTFEGAVGTVIPINTTVTNESGNIIFNTTESGIINSTGYVNILAVSSQSSSSRPGEDIPASSLTKLPTPIDGVTSVTNHNSTKINIPAETLTQFKARVYNAFQGNRDGTIEKITNNILKIDGVDPRTVFFNQTEINKNGYIYRGIEAVIGGGSPEDIAYELANSILMTNNLVSNPSDADTSRTVERQVKIKNSIFKVTWTIPKLSLISIDLKVSVQHNTYTGDVLKEIVVGDISNYINSLTVGTKLTQGGLDYTFMETLDRTSFDPANIGETVWTVSKDDKVLEWTHGIIEDIAYDEYLSLENLTVSIIN